MYLKLAELSRESLSIQLDLLSLNIKCVSYSYDGRGWKHMRSPLDHSYAVSRKFHAERVHVRST